MSVGALIDEAREARGRLAVEGWPDTCTVSTPGEPTRDAYHEDVSGTPAEVVGVPCNVKPMSAREREGGTGAVGVADHVIELPYVWEGTLLNVSANSTVVVDEREVNPARTFKVTGPLHSSTAAYQRVAATLRQ